MCWPSVGAKPRILDGGAVEARSGADVADPPGLRVIDLLDQLVGGNLGIGEQLVALENRRTRNLLGVESLEPIRGRVGVKHLPHQFEAHIPIFDSRGAGRKARIVGEFGALRGARETLPLVGQTWFPP